MSPKKILQNSDLEEIQETAMMDSEQGVFPWKEESKSIL